MPCLLATSTGASGDGVFIQGNQLFPEIISAGDISITGFSAGDSGIEILHGVEIQAQGSAALTIAGTSTGRGDGVHISGEGNTRISSVDGPLQIMGDTTGNDRLHNVTIFPGFGNQGNAPWCYTSSPRLE